MSKPIHGILLGAILGILDGLSTWFVPEARPYMLSIVVGSTLKGLVTGFVVGIFASRVDSVLKGIGFGLAVGLVLSFIVAALPSPTGTHPYVEIMIPGGIIGLILGFTTQKYGRPGDGQPDSKPSVAENG
ncbi:hypothetical protein MJD09_08575 [bacterium]|nr:hypothetical protein [bacterium]